MSDAPSTPPLTFSQKLVKVPIYWVRLTLMRSARFRTWMERRRHRSIAEQAICERTPPAFLNVNRRDIARGVRWAIPHGLLDPPKRGLDPYVFTKQDAQYARDWILDPAHLTDELLVARLDSFSDQIGRTSEALRTRIELTEQHNTEDQGQRGTRILFDGRSMQLEHYSTRGIGRYAEALLEGILEEAGADRVDIFVDLRQRDIPAHLTGGARLIPRIPDANAYALLVQPSPMTSSPLPLVSVLRSAPRSVAVTHDLIPLHYPDYYLPDTAAVAEYVACLDALAHFTNLLCNSNSTAAEVMEFLARIDRNNGRTFTRTATVVWPQFIADLMERAPSGGDADEGNATSESPIVVVAGDEPRKNLVGALAAVGLATTGGDRPPIVVVGMAGHHVQVHHTAIGTGLRPEEATTSARLSDEDLFALLGRAHVVLIPSYDEGLSLPVIEAAESGSPVVASDIPAHRELLGAGAFLAPAGDLEALTRALTQVRGDRDLAARQRDSVRKHHHEILEDWIAQQIRELPPHQEARPRSQTFTTLLARPRIAFATPWPPQHSGVADFSAATVPAIAQLCDLTLVTTSKPSELPPGVTWMHVNDLEDNAGDFDHIVLVLGNSSLHLPFFELLDRVPATVLSHDTRFVEFYAALRGGGVEPLMLCTKDESAPKKIHPPLTQQLADMRLVQNHAYWEVARQAQRVLVHTPTAVDRLERETGVRPIVLPFANYRTPEPRELTAEYRGNARKRLGFDRHPSNTLHLASFGFVDMRAKMADVVLESAIWLSDWGHTVSLILVGEAEPNVQQQLEKRAKDSGLFEFRITGYANEDEYCDYLAAIDLGLQLRISPYLGVAGALSDLAARGRVALGSRGVCQDVGTPDFIDRLPDAISPVTVAEAIESRWSHMPDSRDVERMRIEYLQQTSPERYAELFLTHFVGSQVNS